MPVRPSSLCGLLFMSATGISLTAVSYGTAPAMNDLLGKR
jgi:tripartite-type tricarboxylate transporter receptor subunit TctC